MSLVDLKHQPRAQGVLQRALACGRMPHAYMFNGPDGVGKELAARGLAQLLLCGSPVEMRIPPADAEDVQVERLRAGCGKCDDCRSVAADTHPDLHVIYRQLGREHPDAEVRKRKALELGVDVLRHFLIEKVGLTPARGRAKVFIVREADRITAHAQNVMLKTLEEPPGPTFIILLVSALDRLLPTTLSRCQVVPFDPLPTRFVQSRLTELVRGLSEEQTEWYAHFSGGSVGRALSIANEQWFERNGRIAAGLASLFGGETANLGEQWTDESKALGVVYRKADPDITPTEATRRGLKAIFQMAAACYADVLRVRSGGQPTKSNPAHVEHVRLLAGQHSPARAADAINRIALAERQLDLNANVQLVVETLLSDLSGLSSAREACGTAR